MPLHNDGKYIESTLKSILCQTYSDFEILIVDDASSDDSLSIVQNNFHDTRIKIFRNETNKGAAYSRNVALKNATGKWVAFLDADDYWAPLKLEKQIQFMETNNYHFSYTEYFEAGPDLKPKFLLSGPKRITFHKMKQCGYMGCLTVMYDKEYIGLLQVDDDVKKRNDYALWLQASKKADCYLLAEPLSIYRKHEGGISNVSIKTKLFWEQAVFRKYISKTAFGAWARAFVVAFHTIIKRRKYKKDVSSYGNEKS